MAGLPGYAAGYKFDDVDHVLKVAIGLALGQWLDGRNPSWFVEKNTRTRFELRPLISDVT